MKTGRGIPWALFGAVLMIASASFAGRSDRSVEQLTAALELGGDGDPLRGVASDRLSRLSGLVETDPARALSVALPEEARQGLSPEVKALVEDRVELSGELEVRADGQPGGGRRLVLRADSGQRHLLCFAGRASTAPAGSRVRVSGVRIGPEIVVLSLDRRGGSRARP